MLTRLLLLFLTFLFLSGGKAIDNHASFHPKNTDKQLTAQNLSKNTDSTSQKVRMMFAGDIMSQLVQIESAHIGDNEYSYDHCFRYIRPIFEQADLVVGNLECTLMSEPPYTGYPSFKSPEQLAEALKKNGFDVLVTSNNHSLDGGLKGVINTIKSARNQGFMHTGTFKNEQYKKLLYPLIIYKNGIKIALLNYTHHTNGLKSQFPSIVNRLDMDVVKKDIQKAKSMKVDFIITFLHWGEEHQLDEDSNQRALAKMMHQWGSDLVVGSHPHVVQPIKNEVVMIDGKSYNYLTAYSLGNFISSQPFVHTEGGIVFEVNIKKEHNRTSIENYYYIPVLRYTPREKGKTHYYALPVSPFENNDNALNMPVGEREKMTNFARRIRAQLGAFGAKERKFTLDNVVLE
jgi:poly-gamma-glutamate synthesis protein (capsule biosynthesis protein)